MLKYNLGRSTNCINPGFLHFFSIFFNLHSGGWNQGPLNTAAT
jgi:hypothetical protein